MYSCVVDTLDRGILVWVGFLVGGGGVCLGCRAVGGGNWKEGERKVVFVVDGIGIELNLAMNLVIFLQLALVGVLYVARCKLEEFMERKNLCPEKL
jgi:hypothetical protein